MARIPDDVIERLKKEVDLAELVGRSGVELKRAGADLVGRCPFHDDDTPSLVVSPDKGLWHCMGACQAGGSAIDWVMRRQGVSFRHAVELMREGVTDAPRARVSTVRRLASPVSADADDQALLCQVVSYYHDCLNASPEALAYLARRRIDDEKALSRFRVGYANRTLGLRIPAKNRKAGSEMRERLTRLGIYRASGHEHFAGSLVVPVIVNGAVTEIYGRKVGVSLASGTPRHLYLPGAHRGVWNADGLVGVETVVLCESLIDALSFFCHGITNVTASYGTAGFTDEHEEVLVSSGASRVLIAYDHDEAGDAAAVVLSERLGARGLECLRVLCPAGADVNDVAVGSEDPGTALRDLLVRAQWMRAGDNPARTKSGEASPDTDGPALGRAAEAPAPAIKGPSPVGIAADPATPAEPAAHDELVIVMSERRWRIRHIPAKATPGTLRVTVMVGSGERFHVDGLDLYIARQRQGFVEAAAKELRCDPEVVKTELGGVLLAVEEAQAATARSACPTPAMTAAEREAALELLCAPDLLDQVAHAFCVLGLVGERESALVTWLTLTSRLSDRPLGAVIQSSSAAGKSTLADAALSLVPAEAKVSYSAMTGQALYYLGETDLSHKVLALAEEEGAARASYALKLLVSEGHLAIASAGKDPATGRLVTNTYEVSGPVALLMTTTAAELEAELANRLVVLAVDEGRAQTRRVHTAQREAETLEGLVAREQRSRLISRHHAAQRLLAPVAVVNPHAPSLSFTDRATRHRRDHAKLLGLIRALALAHQFQRERKVTTVEGRSLTYIEASPDDVATAERLAAGVLATTTDELAPSTRRLYEAIRGHVATHPGAFTRRGLRAVTGFGDTQLKVHLARLVDLEYLVASRRGPASAYELADSAQADEAECTYDPDRPGQMPDRPGQNGDRPVGNGDRSAIGRFSDKPTTSDNARSVGIGRSSRRRHGESLSHVTGSQEAETRDRPDFGPTRGSGRVPASGVVAR